MTRKYELTDETLTLNDTTTLHQIKALVDIPESYIKAGDVGGFVETEDNLSHDGACWIFDDACVFGKAVVRNNAIICDGAFVHDNAIISGNATICDYACVSGSAYISGKALVCGKACVSGEAQVRDTAIVSERARVYGNACIYSNAWIHSGARISGGMFFLNRYYRT